jgi:AcrR family transcriptional regulator
LSGSQAATARRGRPSTGARERILAGCLEVLKADGYAGLTTAKVAAASGESKALIAYHFGSKQGLVAAAGRELGQSITEEILVGVEGARTVEEIVSGALAGTWTLLERDERLPRVYFDLNAVSVVEDGVRDVMREVKGGFRTVLTGLLREADDPVSARAAPALAVMIIAGIEGLCLERIERGDTAELRRARELFVRSIVAGLAQSP